MKITHLFLVPFVNSYNIFETISRRRESNEEDLENLSRHKRGVTFDNWPFQEFAWEHNSPFMCLYKS